MQFLSIRAPRLILLLAAIFFALVLVNGYALNLFNQSASPAAIFVMLAAEFLWLVLYLHSPRLRLMHSPLELAGFLLVVFFAWVYFMIPALPTLLPPSYSGDAANHLGFIDAIYSTGEIISDYPGGPALITAALSHWVGWLPIRLMHPLAAFWVALSAGGIYDLACALLPDKRENKIIALTAPAALFFMWNYFAGVLIGINYFFTQVAAQFFIVSFVISLDSYLESHHDLWLGAMALCLIAIGVSFQLWLPLPAALIAWSLWRASLRASRGSVVRAAAIVFGIPALFGLMLFFFAPRFIPDLGRARGGGVTIEPSFETLGGWFLIAPALGIWLARRGSYRARTAFTFAAFVIAQTTALGIARFLGLSPYWFGKSFSLWVFPLAILSVIPIHVVIEKTFLSRESRTTRHAALALPLTAIALAALVWLTFPPPAFSPLSESDVQAAVRVKNNLNTPDVNVIGTKTLATYWIFRMWGEKIPDDLIQDYVSLGPKTFEEWRDDPSWGKYLFISDSQHFNLGSSAKVIVARGGSLIAERENAPPVTAATPPLGRFGDALALLDYNLPRQSFRPGETISATAQIETVRVPGRQVMWRVQLRDLENNLAAEIRRDPFDNKFPFHRWSSEKTLTQSFALPLGYAVRPGLYDLQVGLYQVGDGAPLTFVASDGVADDVIRLGRVKIAMPPVTTHELASLMRAQVQFGSLFQLLGYRAKKLSPAHPGDAFALDLYWQARAQPREDYTVFVHLLDSAGALVAQMDSAPRHGTYPTSVWDSGEVVTDPYMLIIPSDAPAGNYRVEVGMYTWPSLKRLNVMDENGAALGDHFVLPLPVRVQQ